VNTDVLSLPTTSSVGTQDLFAIRRILRSKSNWVTAVDKRGLSKEGGNPTSPVFEDRTSPVFVLLCRRRGFSSEVRLWKVFLYYRLLSLSGPSLEYPGWIQLGT